MRRAAALLAIVLCGVLSPAALAAEPKFSIPDIEDEVMCLVCGTALNVAGGPSAEQQRQVIRQARADGLTKEQALDRLVDEYGEEVLADPPAKGFDLAAWLVPIVAGVLGLLGVAFVARRWRRTGLAAASAPAAAAGPDLAPEDARRLDAELSALDR